jgi:hypothetical protein
VRANGVFQNPKISLNPAVGGTAMLNKLWSLTWYSYIGAWLVDPRFSIQYIGRYAKRAVMAEYRTPPQRGDGKIARYSYKDYANGAKTSYMTLKVYPFMGPTSERLYRHQSITVPKL